MLGERSYLPQLSATLTDTGYRSWVRGENGAGTGAARNILYPINSNAYNGNNLNDADMGSNHTGGTNFCLGDGSVRFISQTADVGLLIAGSSINGKEPYPLP
jgi:prepilin-type processing-associated H-X9-DG protein